MGWLGSIFRAPPDDPGAAPTSSADRSVDSAQRMLSTLIDAYGEDSPLVRQQRSYVNILQREQGDL